MRLAQTESPSRRKYRLSTRNISSNWKPKLEATIVFKTSLSFTLKLRRANTRQRLKSWTRRSKFKTSCLNRHRKVWSLNPTSYFSSAKSTNSLWLIVKAKTFDPSKFKLIWREINNRPLKSKTLCLFPSHSFEMRSIFSLFQRQRVVKR
jgi:hypothetical protein